MDFKDITGSISEAESIPAGQVRKICKAFIERISVAIDNGEKLGLPGLVFSPRTLPAREAEFDKPARPARKVVTIRRRSPKTDEDIADYVD